MNIEATLKERGARYGDFTEHARICQEIKDVMGGTEGWGRLSPVQRQALEVIADKQARILNGDPNYIDNWHDIIGYAKLVEDRLNAEQAPVRDVKKEVEVEVESPLGDAEFLAIDMSDPTSIRRGIMYLERLAIKQGRELCGCDSCVAQRVLNGG